ncbi:DPP IV N-terminal domain-containing protein [Streptomyces sp. NPDC002722]|uniref:DPP IV N-terminal domain-containing protein n=1 Tax=Streptomyces sp. NPDC002722 TaxID=3154425 RepID=UPI00332B56A1
MNPTNDATADDTTQNTDGFPGQFGRTHRFSLGVPRGFTVSPDGARVLFLRSTSGTDPVSRLWLYEDGAERLLADPLGAGRGDTAGDRVPPEELVRRERAGETSSGVVSYATDAQVRLAAFALDGGLRVVRTDGGPPRRIRTAGPVVDPRPSPDGTLIAYVSGGALRVVTAEGTDDRVLAAPDGDRVTYGLSDHVSAESIHRSRGYWWSPGSDALLVARVDTSMVRRRYISDPAHPERPPREMAYPAAGTANAGVSLHLVRVSGERLAVRLPREAETGHPEGVWTDPSFEYVVSAAWDGYGPLVSVQTRDQRSVYVLAVDPGTGGTRVLSRAHDRAWVALRPGTPLRLPSGALVVPARPGGDSRGWRSTVWRRLWGWRSARWSEPTATGCSSPRARSRPRSMSGRTRRRHPVAAPPSPCASARHPVCTQPWSAAPPWCWTAEPLRDRRSLCCGTDRRWAGSRSSPRLRSSYRGPRH